MAVVAVGSPNRSDEHHAWLSLPRVLQIDLVVLFQHLSIIHLADVRETMAGRSVHYRDQNRLRWTGTGTSLAGSHIRMNNGLRFGFSYQELESFFQRWQSS